MDLNTNKYLSFKEYDSKDFTMLKQTVIDVGISEYSRGCKENLDEHLAMIEKEFSQKTYLEFYHSWLIVNIRRKIDLDKNIKLFFLLWDLEADFLLKKLSSRWLISACDTILDYSTDPLEESIAMAAILFINTIKLYETEELMMFEENDIQYPKTTPPFPMPLFDGMTTFMIGGGDMINNMIKRIYSLSSKDKCSYQILIELLKRAHKYNTIFQRFFNKHKIEKTRWRVNE